MEGLGVSLLVTAVSQTSTGNPLSAAELSELQRHLELHHEPAHSFGAFVKMGGAEDINPSTSHPHITRINNALNTPPVNTPPAAMTPPIAIEKRRIEQNGKRDSGTRSDRSTTVDAAVDPNALSKALMREFEDTGRTSSRDITPRGSPSRKRQRIIGDR